MIEKRIKFFDLNNKPVERTYYFHYSKAELVEMMLEHGNGEQDFLQYLQSVLASGDRRKIIKTFKDLLVGAVGVKSEDNLRFVKNQAIQDEFAQSDAYVELFMELFEEARMTEFIEGMMPSDLVQKAKAQTTVSVPLPAQDVPVLPKFTPEPLAPGSVTPIFHQKPEFRHMSAEQLRNMTNEELDEFRARYEALGPDNPFQNRS